MITGLQVRMARAALNWSAQTAADKIAVSKQALASYERCEEKLSADKVAQIEAIFIQNRIYFGPAHGVCVGHNEFGTERWFAHALWNLLIKSGIYPTSTDLIRAANEKEPE